MKTLNDRYEMYRKSGLDHIPAAMRALEQSKNQHYKRQHLIYERIRTIIDRGGYFITLTYRSEDLTDEETGIKQAKAWARKHLVLWIGNVDYGEDYGRLHWHIVGHFKERDPTRDTWDYGFMYLRFIRVGDDIPVGKYITKLMRHSMKSTAGRIFKSKRKE